MKKCTKCGVEKDETEFSKCSSTNDGLQTKCKLCAKKMEENRKNKNPKEFLDKKRNSELKRRQHNIEKIREQSRKSTEIHRNKYPNKVKEQSRKSKLLHKTTSNIVRRNNNRKRKLIDPLFKLRHNISSLILLSIKNNGFKKSSRTSAILGCTFEEFKLHIEKQFTDGMTWANQGLWHLDHIYPVSLAVDEQHLLQLNHYTNFQPLWAEDNLKKGNKLPEEYTNEI